MRIPGRKRVRSAARDRELALPVGIKGISGEVDAGRVVARIGVRQGKAPWDVAEGSNSGIPGCRQNDTADSAPEIEAGNGIIALIEGRESKRNRCADLGDGRTRAEGEMMQRPR